MNVLRAVQVFSPQVTAALQHLQANFRSDPAARTFKEAAPTIDFMKIKQWFDIHDTTYSGSDCKTPISQQDDYRLLWLENEFVNFMKNVQQDRFASGGDAFTDETFNKSTVQTTRYLLSRGVRYVLTRKFNSDPIEAVFGRLRSICGGNDALDARAVTTALDHIVKESGLSMQLHAPDVDDAEKMAAYVPQKVSVRTLHDWLSGRVSTPKKRSGGRGPDRKKKPDNVDLLRRVGHSLRRNEIHTVAKLMRHIEEDRQRAASKRHSCRIDSNYAQDVDEAWLPTQEAASERKAHRSDAHYAVAPPLPLPVCGVVTPR
ncbi:hypothetical protein HPB49_025511 [Dermacentor silvarum]|uniref:Uncharacterized protein n=1 Tax=Dermacentor silvarum TaxID=543639 RepID=A0ACB8CTX3_DERSI|nr:hypothetical protein HPB49_025511 [Dermacentor silvarum]